MKNFDNRTESAARKKNINFLRFLCKNVSFERNCAANSSNILNWLQVPVQIGDKKAQVPTWHRYDWESLNKGIFRRQNELIRKNICPISVHSLSE